MKRCISSSLIILFSTMCYFIMSSCDIKSPVENVKVIFNSLPITTVISGNVVDAATGEPIQGSTTYLTIEGYNKDDVVDLTGNSKDEFSTNFGFLEFALTESVVPTESSPVKIVLVVKCNGYLTTSLPLNIYRTGSTNFRINLVNKTNLPNGAASANGNGNANNSGVVQNDFDVVVKEPNSGATVTMSIPSGTIFYDANGNPLKGNLTASITYFNNQDEESLRSFPGGFFVTTEENGIQSEGVFSTAGLFDLTLKDANGKEAKTLSKSKLNKSSTEDTLKPLITAEIPSGTMNPETNAEVKAGDSISVWSIDINSSLWTHEKKVVVQGPNSNGKFYVQFRIDHFSNWNLDWKDDACSYGIKIRIVGKPTGYPVTLVIYGLSGNFHYSHYTTDDIVQMLRAPRNQRVKIIAYDGNNCDGAVIGSIIIDDLCANITVDLNLTFSPPPSTDIIIYAEGFCPCDTNLIIRPNGNPIWYRSDVCNSNWVFAGTVTDGSITIPGISLGVRYIYATSYEGEWYTVGGIVYEDHAEIDPGLSTENIVYSQIARQGDYTILKFKGQLSDNICKDLCAD